ncbi:hypothetical protein T02_11801, partial [Trichinella nativa]
LSIIICKRKEQKWNNRATDAQLIGWYSKEILLLNVEKNIGKPANGDNGLIIHYSKS